MVLKISKIRWWADKPNQSPNNLVVFPLTKDVNECSFTELKIEKFGENVEIGEEHGL
jgi:hypothetical protein